MKQIIIVLLLLLSFPSLACDNCNVFINISPNDYRSSIGVYHHTRYMIGTYNSLGQVYLKHGGENIEELVNKKIEDFYRTYEVRGTYYFGQKWRTVFTLPFIDNTQQIDGLAKYRVRGIGDPIVMQTYQVYNSKFSNDSTPEIVHRFEIGGGIKVPAGSIEKRYPFGEPNIDLQPGTGSWDFLFLATYSARFKQLGFSSNLNVKFNTYNKNNFRYGNTLNLSLNTFYIKNFKRIVLMPYVGGYIEHFEKDYEYSIINDSGGATFFGNIGFKLYKGNWSLTAQYQKVFSNKLNGDTQLFTINRTTVGLNYNF